MGARLAHPLQNQLEQQRCARARTLHLGYTWTWTVAHICTPVPMAGAQLEGGREEEAERRGSSWASHALSPILMPNGWQLGERAPLCTLVVRFHIQLTMSVPKSAAEPTTARAITASLKPPASPTPFRVNDEKKSGRSSCSPVSGVGPWKN